MLNGKVQGQFNRELVFVSLTGFSKRLKTTGHQKVFPEVFLRLRRHLRNVFL